MKNKISGEKSESQKLIRTTEEYNKFLDQIIKNDNKIKEKIIKLLELLDLYDKKNEAESEHYNPADTRYLEGFRFGFFTGVNAAQKK